ncbi:MerR family transcriptional regulator [bacterium]|nr:MerR family transcriptional regulator [bacterium]
MTDADRSDPPDLSRKLYYTIGEVSELTGIKPHVLRYWESEFPTLRPRKGRGGSRRYRRHDIEHVLTIRELLHERGYRIDGARRHLEERRRRPAPVADGDSQLSLGFADMDRSDQLAHLRRELEEIRDLVRRRDEAAG